MGATIGPLISTQWNQSDPYNRQCPEYEEETCIVGCVATAMSQMMNYWKYPTEQPWGSVNYTTSSLEIEVVIDEFEVIDWEQIVSTKVTSSSSAAEIDEVSKLCFYAGAASYMDYTPISSGAYSFDARDALVYNFMYPGSTEYKWRGLYSDETWESLMRFEIDSGRPAYYAGGSHAFILDGYRETWDGYEYHFNLGWGGVCDGWYDIDVPGEGCSGEPFSDGQEAIVNVGIPSASGSLTVETVVEGSGSALGAGAGAVMRSDYAPEYDGGIGVVLTAEPYPGYKFLRWFGGGITNTTSNPVIVRIDGDTTVQAVFQVAYQVNSPRNCGGSICVSPASSDGYYGEGQVVEVTAAPTHGWQFDHWEGDLSGSDNPCTVTMDDDINATPIFTKQEILTCIVTGQGTVTCDPSGVAFDYDEDVVLEATASEGWSFRQWWGDVDEDWKFDPRITLIMDQDRMVQAEFVVNNGASVALSTTVVGEGTVLPFGGSFAAGSDIELQALPRTGWTFVGWEGDASGDQPRMMLAMDSAKSVTGVFAKVNEPDVAIDTGDSDQGVASDDSEATTNDEADIDSNVEGLTQTLPCATVAIVVIASMLFGFALVGGLKLTDE